MSQVQLDHNTKLTHEVCEVQITNLIAASKKWWLGHRPLVYSEADHLENPTVNIPDSSANDLAIIVANLVRLGL